MAAEQTQNRSRNKIRVWNANRYLTHPSVGFNAEIAFIKIKSEIQAHIQRKRESGERDKNKLQGNENRLFRMFLVLLFLVLSLVEMQKNTNKKEI